MEKHSYEVSPESIQEKARIAAERLREALSKLESLRDGRQEFREGRGYSKLSSAGDSIRADYLEQVIRARRVLLEVIDLVPEGSDERLDYHKLIVDCDAYMPEEAKSREY